MQIFMKDSINFVFKDNLIRISIILSILFILIQGILVAVFSSKFPPLIPFFNSRPWGEARLVSSSIILFIPLLYIFVFIVNSILSSLYYKKNMLVARLLSFSALLFIFLGILAFVQIIFLVF